MGPLSEVPLYKRMEIRHKDEGDTLLELSKIYSEGNLIKIS